MQYLHEPRVRVVFFGLWCVGWVVVSVALLAPLPTAMPESSDTLAHFGAFALMAFTAVSFCHSPRRLALVALLTAAAGLLLEYAQAFLPYRGFEVYDAVADVLGAGTGYLVALIVLHTLIRPADPALREARAARS